MVVQDGSIVAIGPQLPITADLPIVSGEGRTLLDSALQGTEAFVIPTLAVLEHLAGAAPNGDIAEDPDPRC